MIDKHLIVSFSGGRTSAYLTLAAWSLMRPFWKSVIVVFANTGEEHPETLRFIRRFEDQYDIPVVWVEATVDMRPGAGTRHRVVSRDCASTMNSFAGPYEQVTRKYGISNQSFPTCTRELKEKPILSYVRDNLGLNRRDYMLAIGIRSDEADRISVSAKERSIIYPLVRMGTTKQIVLDFWRAQPIDLEIPEHLGNCAWCWKKSAKKLALVAEQMPQAFAFPARMERLYRFVGPEKEKHPEGRKFFRGNRSVDDVVPSGCGESCEAFSGDGE